MFRKIILSTLMLMSLSCSQTENSPSNKNLTAYQQQIEKHRTELHDFYLSKKGPLNQKQKGDFLGLSYFPVNERYKIMAEMIKISGNDTITMQTSSNQERKYIRFAQLNFELDQTKCTLVLYQFLGDESHYFLPFKDLTNGVSTYGGGRYLDIENTGNGSTLELDFNKIYHPYCAYVDGFSCPIPPIENTLEVKIEAGSNTLKPIFVGKNE
ncbi:MAG: DUF1684 domain-containing protein [Flavobacteriales bacterium]|nr:DUF1684 domain-containing protein [Flavobacteriales bacterium]